MGGTPRVEIGGSAAQLGVGHEHADDRRGGGLRPAADITGQDRCELVLEA